FTERFRYFLRFGIAANKDRTAPVAIGVDRKTPLRNISGIRSLRHEMGCEKSERAFPGEIGGFRIIIRIVGIGEAMTVVRINVDLVLAGKRLEFCLEFLDGIDADRGVFFAE